MLSPCCYKQTLDVHDSPMARAVREEIRDRLSAGESPEEIERLLVARHGKQIIAVPRDSPLSYVAGALLILIAASGIALVMRGRRWMQQVPELEPASAERDAYDDILDAKLHELDS